MMIDERILIINHQSSIINHLDLAVLGNKFFEDFGGHGTGLCRP